VLLFPICFSLSSPSLLTPATPVSLLLLLLLLRRRQLVVVAVVAELRRCGCFRGGIEFEELHRGSAHLASWIGTFPRCVHAYSKKYTRTCRASQEVGPSAEGPTPCPAVLRVRTRSITIAHCSLNIARLHSNTQGAKSRICALLREARKETVATNDQGRDLL